MPPNGLGLLLILLGAAAHADDLRCHGTFAAADIASGEHVHTQNVEFRGTAHDYEFSTDLRHVEMVPEAKRDSFMGFRRPNGGVGTRNYVAVLTSVNCSATAARKIAAHFTPEVLAPYPNIDGVCAFVHGTGCGMAGCRGWAGPT